MSDYVITPLPVVAVPVVGGKFFPVGGFFAWGAITPRMRGRWAMTRSRAPVFLHQTRRCAGDLRRRYGISDGDGNLHHEMELVVAIGQGGKDIAVTDALGHVYGYAAGSI